MVSPRSPLVVMLALLMFSFASPVEAQLPGDAVSNGGFELAAEPARDPVCTVVGPGSINVFEPGNPLGLPWVTSVNLCHSSALKAAGWSSGTTVEVDDFDGDGDREAKFLKGPDDPSLGDHNMWQSYASLHQAYVANFSALSFQVESGVIAHPAKIILSLSDTPLAEPSPWVGISFMCQLTFSTAQLQPDANGTVMVDPTEGAFRSRYSTCDDEAANWTAADPAERREILDGLRIVQHSYWGWNRGPGDVVIDDVTMLGSRTVVEALLG